MSRKLLSDCRVDWRRVAERVGEITGRLSDLTVELLLGQTSDLQEQVGVFRLADRLWDVEQRLGGMSYLCTPQSEWLGGDQWAERAPHVVTSCNWPSVKGIPDSCRAVTIRDYIESVVPEGFQYVFWDQDVDNEWLRWDVASVVGQSVKELVAQASLVFCALRDVSESRREEFWITIAKQCRVWAMG